MAIREADKGLQPDPLFHHYLKPLNQNIFLEPTCCHIRHNLELGAGPQFSPAQDFRFPQISHSRCSQFHKTEVTEMRAVFITPSSETQLPRGLRYSSPLLSMKFSCMESSAPVQWILSQI